MSHQNEMRPNYFIFIGFPELPLDPPLIFHGHVVALNLINHESLQSNFGKTRTMKLSLSIHIIIF